ncbi:MAG: hypothetical protein ABR87_00510 [Cryomorphaceae bacterium BACL7 MAG-121220-bin83]|nr:MAG: hypothetical protein ABR87_00510 [Cryomorphaceae bacterium BACL7 MAG-121220-bin83]
MSLTDSLSSLRQTLTTETPSAAHLSELHALLSMAYEQSLRSRLAQVEQAAQAEVRASLAQLEKEMAAKLAHAEAEARAQAEAQKPQSTDGAVTAEKEPPTIPAAAPVSVMESTQAHREQEAIPAPAETSTPPASPDQASLSTPASAKSVNARYAALKVGLNDRMAFVKHLFAGEDDDFQRVIAALATMESREECQTFLETAVYDDYDWSQKPEIAERFLSLVFARFE